METVKFVGIALITIFSFTSRNGANSPYITVAVKYTPTSFFKSDSTTILVINQYNLAALKSNNQKKLNTLKSGAYNAIQCAGALLKQLPHVNVINLVDSANFKPFTDSIKHLALKYKADYVLTLKNFDADMVISEVQSSAPYFNTLVHAGFMLYESNGLYYKKLDGTASYFQSGGKYMLGFYGALYVHPAIELYKKGIDTTALHASQNALQEYFPYTIAHDRFIYTDGYLKKAVKKIYSSNLTEAIILLKPQLQDADAKKAGKAAYNLAVVYEARGNIGQAIAMAQLSLYKFNNPYAASILEDLKVE